MFLSSKQLLRSWLILFLKNKKEVSYLCRVMFKLPVHALILFCASRWVIPSVLIPSMVRTTSPIPTCARAALPPSLSWNSTRMVNEKQVVYIFWTQDDSILFTVLFHRLNNNKNCIFLLCDYVLWKLLHYLSGETVFTGSCSFFTGMTQKYCTVLPLF